VVDGNGLENRRAGNGTVGSNPTPSAKLKPRLKRWVFSLAGGVIRARRVRRYPPLTYLNKSAFLYKVTVRLRLIISGTIIQAVSTVPNITIATTNPAD
jgi:hypothetical protein